MKTKFIFTVLLLIISIFLVILSCETKPTSPSDDNPFDPNNTSTSGDPFKLQAVIANGGITLTWNAPQFENFESYRIYKRENENSSYSVLNTLNKSQTQYTDTIIVNGYSYWYRVSAVDDQGNETGSTNISAVNINTDPILVINGGNQYTSSIEVNITILAGKAQQMMFSNENNFSGSLWENYSSNKNWTLLTGDGDKIVYLKVKYENGNESTIVQDTITLDLTPPIPILVVIPDSGITSETSFQFNPTASYDNIFSTDSLQVRYDWEDDGNWDTNWQELGQLNHQYSVGGGDKIVKLEIIDGVGWIADTTFNLFVNTIPVPSFTATIDSLNRFIVHFDASTSYDYEDGSNVEYCWDFDSDGIWDTGFLSNSTIDYEYSAFGTYYPVLKVRDMQHLEETTSRIVTISLQIDFTKSFGGSSSDVAKSVQQTTDGGYIITGRTESYGAGLSDFWLVKTDASGNLQWDQTFGGSYYDFAESVQLTSDGGYIIAGYTDSYGTDWSEDFWLIKTDGSGNQQWSQTFGDSGFDEAYSVQQTTDGGYIITGWTESYGAGLSDFWLVKTDASGNLQWDQTFGGSDYDEAHSVQQTNDGGYIIVGITRSYGTGDYDYWLIKTDASGNLEWDQTFGGSAPDWAHSVQLTSDGGYIIIGTTYSYGAGGSDFWLVKTDASGNLQWDQTFGGSNSEDAFSVQETKDGGYIITGGTRTYGAGNYDFWLVKTDASGNMQWDQTFGGSASDFANSIQQTNDGGYIIAGGTGSYGSGSSDFWLIKVR